MRDEHGIQAADLVRQFKKGPRAVDGIDLHVAPGEIYGFLGPNGAGKSTTVHILTTLLPPTAGRARVAGFDVAREGPAVRRAIGAALQEAALDPVLTGREHLRLQTALHGLPRSERRHRGDGLLERVGLAEAADRKVGKYSGGMKRRLDLALALVHEPRVLFLDEPTTGLDPQSRLALWDHIAELREEGHTVLLTTHVMEEADRLCDRVAIMDHGRILALDTPATLKRSLAGDAEVSVGVSGDAEKFAADLTARLGPDADDPARVSGNTVHLPLRGDAEAVLATVIATAGEQGVAVTDVSVAEPTLETVFINLTGKELRE